jgi:hypothetical protein
MAEFKDEVLVALEYLFRDLAANLDELIHEHGADHIKAGLRAYYAKRIAPIDVPYVPDSLEPHVIDTPLLMGLDRAFDYFHERVHKAANPPPTTP